MGLLQKDLRYGLASRIINSLKMYTISDEVMKFTEKNIENWQEEEKAYWVENLTERYLPGRCANTITICDSDDATKLHI